MIRKTYRRLEKKRERLIYINAAISKTLLLVFSVLLLLTNCSQYVEKHYTIEPNGLQSSDAELSEKENHENASPDDVFRDMVQISSETTKDSSEESLNHVINGTSSLIEETESGETVLKEITREEAGLNSIPYMDFSNFNLNHRIFELLVEKRPYTNEDMSVGIIAPFYITERFKEPIVDNISIGTSINNAIDILGIPSYRNENVIIYKTENYYIAFFGEEYIEMANFFPSPKTYDKNVLKNILAGLCLESVYLTSFLEENNNISDFFERQGFIHGGGNYAISDNGVNIDTLSNYIEIYNNFEGDLYSTIEDIDFEIKYINSDSIMEDMMWDFSEYSYTNKDFTERGEFSPSGKYIAKYDYIYSMSHYFTIRTVDCSKPDYRISALVSDFEWVNDDYILYTGIFSNMPAVIKVTPTNGEYECVRFFPEIGDWDFSEYSFSIKEINENTIVLEDKEADVSKGEKVIWEFPYSFDENGIFFLMMSEGRE